MCNVEVPPKWELLTEQNLYDVELSLNNSLDKNFLDFLPSSSAIRLQILTKLLVRLAGMEVYAECF